ncbi:MAG TPA: ABC transporter substrate-binding protein [Methylomirabilota bacterium]|nr:ABC transporter substrate-binding protein [Methylomirabilota bacterium]
MKFCLFAAIVFLMIPEFVFAEKLTLAYVAVNPSQGMLWVAKDSGILAKHGFTADIILVPGTPRTIQALIAGDLDFAVAGSPAAIRARLQGADVVMLASLNSYSSQRVFVKRDSKLQSFSELRGKIIGVTQYGSAGDTFLRAALKKIGMKDSDVTVLQMGGTPGVAQALEAGRIEVAVLGDSGMMLVFRGIARPLKGASSRELGFKSLDGPLNTTERKIKADRGMVLRFVQAYVEAIHYFKTNKAGTIRIFQKYMRGLSEDDLAGWLEDLRESLRPLPYPDEEALRADLEQIGAPKSQALPSFINTTFLDEIQKSGLIDKLYK